MAWSRSMSAVPVITTCKLILIILVVSLMEATAVSFNDCTGESLNECGVNQNCDDSKHKCECLFGYETNPQATNSDDVCVKSSRTPVSPPTAEGTSWTVIVLVVSTISLLSVAAVFLIRKYDLIEWARQKLEARRNTSVMYEDVMIGQDDPPITA